MLESIEKASKEVQENIEKGNTQLEVFDPLKPALKIVLKELTEAEIKPATEINDEEFKNYKRLRTNTNKVIKFVKDNRMSITKKLDNLKKGFMDKEKEMTKEVLAIGDSLKTVIDEKAELLKIEEIKKSLPGRKEKLAKLKEITQPSDEELLQMEDTVFVEFLMAKMDENTKLLAEKQAQADREAQIKADADANAKKEAEEKASADILKIEQDKEEAERKLREIEEANELQVKAKKEETERLSKDKKLKSFLKENNYNKETDILKQTETEIIIYRTVNKFTK